MRGLLRLVALLIYVGAGYLIGSLVGRLVLIPVAAVAHVSHSLQTGLSVAAGLLGIFSAVGYWRAKFGPCWRSCRRPPASAAWSAAPPTAIWERASARPPARCHRRNGTPIFWIALASTRRWPARISGSPI